MYTLATTEGTFYAEAIRYIYLHQNGSYVSCPEADAKGVCAKIVKTSKDGSKTMTDTVFALSEGGLHGTEPLCTSIISAERNERIKLAETIEVLNIILGGETI